MNMKLWLSRYRRISRGLVKALKLIFKPNDPDLWFCNVRSVLRLAEIACRRAIRLTPDRNLSLTFLGDVSLAPNYFNGKKNNKTQATESLGFEETNCFQEELALKKISLKNIFFEGFRLSWRALGCSAKILGKPDQSENWINLSEVCISLAEVTVHLACRLSTNHAQYLSCLGNLYLSLDQLKNAERFYYLASGKMNGTAPSKNRKSSIFIGNDNCRTGLLKLADIYKQAAHTAVSRGQFELGNTSFQRNRKILAYLYDRQPNPVVKKRFLRSMWSSQIGHLAHLDGYIKAGILGWRSNEPIVMLAPPGQIANRFFMNMWEPYLTIISDPQEIARLEPQVLTQEDYLSIFEINNRGMWAVIACAAAQKVWEREGRPQLLHLDQGTIEKGWKNLELLGIPRGSWFVGIHIRSPQFYAKQGGDWTQNFRNAEWPTYFPAIEAVVKRGGFVVRMGDRLPESCKIPGLIDYANSPLRSDWMDVFLCAQSRFFVGCQSGVSFVPSVFGVPTVMTNWISIGVAPWYGNNLFIPKLLVSKNENRVLTFGEALRSKLGFSQIVSDFESQGVTWRDNTPEEILRVVEEMMYRLDQRQGPGYEHLQEQWARLARKHGVIVNSRMGARFLADHSDLLADGNGDNSVCDRNGFEEDDATDPLTCRLSA